MSANSLDSIKQAITFITKTLNFNETYLAGFLGVTEKSLNEWKKRGLGDLPPKAKRLVRLFEVVQYLQTRHPEIPQSAYKSLIENGRITIDPNDPEDGSTSLISFILAEPEASAWAPCVEEVVREFISSNIKETEQHREANQSVRHA
jgi:hypothetical protein